jgi:biotin---protein ligase
MAVVQAIRAYGRGYEKIPLRLKWPNDIYAAVSSSSTPPTAAADASEQKRKFVKVGGILINSTYSGSAYGLVVGIGVNVGNAAPTTGLDALARECGLPVFQREVLLARILGAFEELYGLFCREGWGSALEDVYYGMWLHR